MVHPTHLVLNLFIFFVPLLGIGNGFTITSRDSKFPPPPLTPSLLSPSTEKPGGIETNTAQLPHHVPLDVIIPSDSTSNSRRGAISLVKREVNPADEGRDNDMLYDPNLMLMSKRSAAALNKVLLAFPGFYDSGSRYTSNDNDMDRSNKEGNYLEPSFNRDTFASMQRRGQKDGQKKYLRCFFNAVSCF